MRARSTVARLALVDQRRAACAQPERPGRARGKCPVGQGFERRTSHVAVAGPRRGLDQFRQGGFGHEHWVFLNDHKRRSLRGIAVPGAQIRDRDDVPADISTPALTPCGPLADLSDAGGARGGGAAAVGEHDPVARVADAEHSRPAAHCEEFAHLGTERIDVLEAAGQGGGKRLESQRGGKLGQRSEFARGMHPSGRRVR